MSRRLIIAACLALAAVLSANAAHAQTKDTEPTNPPHRGPSTRGQGRELRTPDKRDAEGPAPQRSRGSRPRFRLTKEQETELMAVLKDRRPDLHERLTRLDKDRHPSYQRSLTLAWRWYQRWKDMSPAEKAAARKLEDARLTIGRTLQAIRLSGEPATAEHKTKLLNAATKAFEAEGALQTIRIEKLEKEIARIKEELEDRTTRREKLIAERVKHLMQNATQQRRRGDPRREGRPAEKPPHKERQGPTTTRPRGD